MTSRVSSKNKEKKAKRKNSVKKKRPNRKKKKTKQRNRKQRGRESNPVYLHVPATPWLLHHSDMHDYKSTSESDKWKWQVKSTSEK